MATCGEPRGRGGGGLRPAAATARTVGGAVVTLAVCAFALGCVSAHSGKVPGGPVFSDFPGVGPTSSPYSHLEQSRWESARKGFLRNAPGWHFARFDRSWRSTVHRYVVPLSREVSLVPMALAGDGHSFFATVFSPEFSGVARVEAKGLDYTPVRAFADPENDQAVGSFDGRWLVWYEYHSHSDFSDFSVWSWDSRSGEVRQIGTAQPAPEGGFWPTSERKPDVRDGFATWTQGTGPDSLSEVHLVDLASGTDRVVRHGHAGESFLVDKGLVVWAESPRRGALSEFVAARVAGGSTVTTPASLRALRGAPGLATDRRAIVFSDPRWQSVWWSPTLTKIPQRIVTSPSGHPVGNSLQVAGRYLGFRVAPYTYLADTATRHYAQIGPGGWLLLDETSLLMMMPSEQKAEHGITDVVFVPLSELPPIGGQK